MSRFSLRSNADNFKITDDKFNRQKFCKTVTVPIKRIQTTAQFLRDAATNPQKDNSNKDVIKRETKKEESATKTSTTSITTTITTIIGGSSIKKQIPAHDVVDSNCVPSTNGRTLLCRLPLIRLTDILEKLKINKTPNVPLGNLDLDLGDEANDEDDEEEEGQQKRDISTEGDNVTTKSTATSATVKILCLYCDKKFSSHKMQLKHVDKFHCQQQDRRCSGRKPPVTQMNCRKRKTTLQPSTSPQSFPGCSFCHKAVKGGNHNSPLNPLAVASDLNALFVHLTDCHADKYYGCKTCAVRFQNVTKLSKHMQLVHKRLPYAHDDSSSKSKDNDTDTPMPEKIVAAGSTFSERNQKLTLKRNLQRSQSSRLGPTNTNAIAAYSNSSGACGGGGGGGVGGVSAGGYCMPSLCVGGPTTQCSTAIIPDTAVIGAEEPILSRLGLTQNRLPNNRKGVRLRRENLLPEALLKSEQNTCANFISSSSSSLSSSLSGSTNSIASSSNTNSSSTTCSPKLRGKAIKYVSNFASDATPTDIIFRVPTRNDILSCVFDDNFYKEVISNVRNNLLFHLDGKILSKPTTAPVSHNNINTTPINSSLECNTEAAMVRYSPQLQPQPPLVQIRSTLVKSPIVVTTLDHSEIHAATTLAATTAFPTLLTAEQYGGDAISSKLRRPHTKNSWKWKWDNVKKFKIVSEGGKMVKKMKHPMFGLRDLSKLDMWTQLTMRQKHEYQSTNQQHNEQKTMSEYQQIRVPGDGLSREVKQRLNEQLNWILDMRLLPHIILEQNEQAIIKPENDEFGITPFRQNASADGDVDEVNGPIGMMHQTFADESFLSMLNLLPNHDSQAMHQPLVLSGEWARPRCYLCMCCGAKFEKLKSLEEHKMFRHSHILSNHYEVVGRELLAGNLLRYLFIPKKALSRYGNDLNPTAQLPFSNVSRRRLFWHKNETLLRELHATHNDESSDCSLQSVLNSTTSSPPSTKTPSYPEDCDTDTKMNPVTTAPNNTLDLINPSVVVSPAHSIQSCSSSVGSHSNSSKQLKAQSNVAGRAISICSKCKRQCNGLKDLYRHMLDCSGDYVWSMAKKRKYRYYCGSKKRRPCNKHHLLELRRSKPKVAKAVVPTTTMATATNSLNHRNEAGAYNSIKPKTPPRPRPSDAESIKKMLENLPPKRVCKKIFPLLTKARSSKQLKPKMMVKQKIYRRLRKTRMSQLAQAARFLTKNKTQQMQQRRKKATSPVKRSMKHTASACTSSSAHISKQSSLYKADNKKIPDKSITPQQMSNEKKKEVEGRDDIDGGAVAVAAAAAVAPDTFKKNADHQVSNKDVPDKDEKRKLEKTSSKEIVESNKGVNNKEVEDEPPAPNKCKVSKDPDGFIISKNINITMKNADDLVAKPLTINITDTQTPAIKSGGSKISVAPLSSLMPSPVLLQEHEKNSQISNNNNNNNNSNNKSNKRSKRINDCIAMLTGKLAEKLRTETGEKAYSYTTNNNNNDNDTSTMNMPNSSRKDALMPMLLPIETVIMSTPEVTITKVVVQQQQCSPDFKEQSRSAITSNCSPKKTPKRKTISRRVIKPPEALEMSTIIPIMEHSTTATIHTLQQNIPTTSLPLANKTKITITTTSASATITTPLTLPSCSSAPFTNSNISGSHYDHLTPIMLKPAVITDISSTVKQIMISPAKATFNSNNRSNKTTTTTTTVVGTPAVANAPTNIIPVCTLNMMPKVPLHIPVAAVAAHMGHLSLPLPLPMPVGMPLIENASPISPSSAANDTPSPLLGAGIVAPVLPLVNASLAMPVHFTASNALPLNIINFNSEPLNLSSASKNLQPCNVNDSQDLTCSNNARSGVGLMPARRQTICGFEARNFVLYDEMEPLDLSKKSGPSAAQSNFGKMSTAMLPPAHLLTPSSATAAAITVQSTSSSLAPTSLQQQQQQPPITALAPISEPGGVLTISALTPEMLSKHFYSNLDLLRIPQIRNSAPASGCSSVTTTTEFDVFGNTNSSNCNNTNIVNVSNISVTSTAVTPSSTAVITTPKSNTKKRNSKSAQNNSNTMTVASSASIIEVVNAVATYSTSTMSTPTPAPTTRGRETNSKCKDNMKNKLLLKMDEEVINHIDDAINSVINAVKASLKDSEEAEKLQQQQHQQSLNKATVLAQSPQQSCLSQIQSIPIAINQINTAPAVTKETTSAAVAVTVMPVKQTVNEVKYLTQSKRSTRSKTLDCRPTALSKMQSFGNIQSEKATVPIKPDQCVELMKVRDISYQTNITSAIISVHKEEQQVTAVTSTKLLPAEVENDAKKASTSSSINKSNSKDLINLSAVKSDGSTVSETLDKKELVAQVRESEHGTMNLANSKHTSSSLTSVGMENNLLVQDSNCRSAVEKVREARTTGSLSTETESVANTITTTSATTITTNNTTLELEQISNINNTSSGFHSSVQSEQNLTGAVSSTTTNTTTTQTVEAPNTNETKTKKQRKRRKNELAAIVADQLLESFKIDKVRRDNLKKLENLAYEKSEDLLLTGMLLMSSTKRTVVAPGAGSGTTIESIESSSNGGVNKRNKNTRNANSTNETVTRSATQATSMKLNNGDKVDGKSRSGAGKQANVKEVDNREPGQTDDRCAKKPGNNKRRPCRGRRGKTLDNENISKLKSSLESFSIDIERQLTEFEAKNVNVFKNVTAATTTTNNASGANGRNNSNLTKGATPPKSSIILRPSILSVTLEAANHNNNSQQASKLTTNGDTSSKSVVSSRDPRLNKNIHKEKGGGGGLATLRKSPKSKTSGAIAADDIGDVDEDNYLTEIAKNVNEKIMSTDNEEFAFKDDGFEMVHELQDDSNSKFSRPPTSMSVRSAPNFNDDRSNFDSTCDENTNINTEALDMDLDDDMSVYTSYSQDLGRGRGGRRRRRRRSILLRKNKKRPSSRERTNDKIECILCKKTFYSANSLAKHNMTLAHVSKVSEQEYLLSKKMGNATAAAVISNEASRHGSLGPYARRTTRRATISEPFCHISTNSISHDSLMKETVRERLLAVPSRIPTSPRAPLLIPTVSHAVEVAANVKQPSPPPEMPSAITIGESQQSLETKVGPKLTEALSKASQINPPCEPNSSTNNLTAFSSNSRLNLNPDERLFFECCNILKGAETHRITSHIAGSSHPSNYAYVYNQEKVGHSTSISSNVSLVGQTAQQHENTVKKSLTFPPPPHIQPPSTCHSDVVNITESASIFRDPYNVVAPSGSSYNKATQERNMRSPTYSGTSQLSAVTNTTTSRFKTKAAMKGYENVNVDLTLQQHESKSRTICKLTELAEIALGNEEKQGSRSQQHFSPICGDDSDDDSTPVNGIIQTPTAPVATSTPITPLPSHVDNIVIEQQQNMMAMNTPEYASLSGVVEHAKNCLQPSSGSTLRNERNKNNETRSSTSSKTIMHSSIIKAAVEEHQKAAPSYVKNNKIVIPDRPFKNIGLEEKESITFQKPKTSAVNLLTDDNSVSTASFSDRDDYDFGSLSCDDEVSVHEEIGNLDEKHLKNSSSESSSESSRATAKTFENKSLIMGRIFKNASTKPLSTKSAITAIKVKSIGVQKDQTPTPKADLNQLFDELRGGGNSRGAIQANHERTTATATSINQLTNQGVGAGLIKSATVGSRSALSNNVRKESTRKETLTTANLNKPQQKTVQASSPPAVVSSTTSTPGAGARKAREARNKSGANVTNRKSRKDISKLQSELGMSPDEIKKLIDEGQRKSKRRCATNRPKKLVEMWSSDEYEEFLSTKDIIALIEEKEQQEKQRKRKSTSSASAVAEKDKELPADVTSSTKDNRRRNTRTVSVAERASEKRVPPKLYADEQGVAYTRGGKLTKSNKKKTPAQAATTITTTREEEPVSTTAVEQTNKIIATGAKSLKKSNKTPNKLNNQNNKKGNETAARPRRGGANTAKTKSKTPAKTKASSRRPSKAARPVETTEEEEEDEETDIADDDDEDYLISELKQNNRLRANKSAAASTKKTVNARKAQVSSTGGSEGMVKESYKRGNNNNNSYGNTNVGRSKLSVQSQQQQQGGKGPTPASKNKRKSQANQSSPRRKRMATEKLYYWSSSSDEDFGLINSQNQNNKSHVSSTALATAAAVTTNDNYDGGGKGGGGGVGVGGKGSGVSVGGKGLSSGVEQYQKHGWIVGDSHKKLVTLLAIAKGNNKKVDSNSGVKSKATKKRN